MTSSFRRFSTDSVLACSVGILALLYSVSLVSRPLGEGRASVSASALTGGLLLTQAALYAIGPRLRTSFGTPLYLVLHGLILLAAGFVHPPLILVLALYAAIIAQAVQLLGSERGVMPIFLGAVLVIAASTAITSGVYRGATIAVILAAAGLVVYALTSALSRRRESALAGISNVVAHADDDVLTARELEVLRHAAAGERSKEIAARLSITERTVKAHLARVYQKLGADSRAAAIAIAARRGLLG